MESLDVRVRRAEPADAAPLAEFGARTFSEAFGAENNPDDLARHMAATYNAAQQLREIADASCATLIAEVDGRYAAWAQLHRSTAPECVTGPSPIELRRFYVDAPWHGRGVAQRLMSATMQAARELGGRTLWLSTWDRNARGMAYYKKSGFVDVGGADFWVGNDRQSDRIFTKPIDG